MSEEKPTSRALYPSVALFLMTAGFIVTKTARDALYFQEDGLLDLPIAYILISLFSVPQAMLVLHLIRRFGPRITRVLAPSVVILIVIGYSFVASPGRGVIETAFFVFVPLVFSIVFSLAWLLTSELLEGQADDVLRAGFSRVAASSMLGGTFGSAIARVAGEVLEPSSILIVGAALVGLAILSMLIAHQKFPEPTVQKGDGSDETAPPDKSFKDVLGLPYTPSLLGIGITAALAAILVDFLFYFEASKRSMSGKEMAQFFANIYLVLNFVALFIQLVITPRLQKRVGVAGTLAVLPLSLLGGAVALVGGGAMVGRSLLRITEGGLKSSVHRSSWEQAYLTYDADIRPLAKVFVDGIGARIAEGLVAVLLLVWLKTQDGATGGGSAMWIPIAIGLVTVSWIALTARLRAQLKDAPAPEGYQATPLPDF